MSRNIPLFIAFRVFFNARFYYPVLGVLFLDLGLSLEQYATLNVIWAVTILLLEIPSGALADVIGRAGRVADPNFIEHTGEIVAIITGTNAESGGVGHSVMPSL